MQVEHSIPRAQIPGAGHGPVLETGLSSECAEFEQFRPTELVLSYTGTQPVTTAFGNNFMKNNPLNI